jgi:hypothetical protein
VSNLIFIFLFLGNICGLHTPPHPVSLLVHGLGAPFSVFQLTVLPIQRKNDLLFDG